jgi:hypothetical protein
VTASLLTKPVSLPIKIKWISDSRMAQLQEVLHHDRLLLQVAPFGKDFEPKKSLGLTGAFFLMPAVVHHCW